MHATFKNYLSGIAIFALLIATGQLSAQTWEELGPTATAAMGAHEIYAVTTDKMGNVYAALSDSSHTYVAQWDGAAWTKLGNLNFDVPLHILQTDAAGNLYVVGDFNSPSFGIEKWDGTTWTFLPCPDMNTSPIGLAIDDAGNVYTSSCTMVGSGCKLFVGKWDGFVWTKLETAISSLPGNLSIGALATDHAGNVYAACNNANMTIHSRVYKWSSSVWSATPLLNCSGYITTLASDNDGNLYAAGLVEDNNLKYQVERYSGGSWSILGGATAGINGNKKVHTLVADAAGHVYAGGKFNIPHIAGSGYDTCYVARWNGSAWERTGQPNLDGFANGAINSLALDTAQNVYAGGQFIHSTGSGWYAYVARWQDTSTAAGIAVPDQSTLLRTYPNPAVAGEIHIDCRQPVLAVTVTDLLGHEVPGIEWNSMKGVCVFPEDGIYLLYISTKTRIYSRKVTVLR